MHNILAIFVRDIRRMLRVPAAWIITFGLIVIPPLYAWFNTAGFWNPYGNTQDIRVAIVNEDKGATNNTLGKLELGDQITDELLSNTELGWYTTTRAKAMDSVSSGKTHAAIIIPKDFSKRIAGVISGDKKRPVLEYVVNEKANGVATKITDTGATTVDTQVNDTFVSTASQVIADTANNAADSIDATTSSVSHRAVGELRDAQDSLNNIEKSVDELNQKLSQIPNSTKQARTDLATLSMLNQTGSDAFARVSTTLTNTNQGLTTFVTNTSGVLDQSSNLLSQASNQTQQKANNVSTALSGANTTVNNTLMQAQQISQETADILAELKQIPLTGVQAIVDKLEAQNTKFTDAVNTLSTINTDLGNTISSTNTTFTSLNNANQTAITQLTNARSTMSTQGLSQLTSGMNTLSSATGSLASRIDQREQLIGQARTILDQVDSASSLATQSLSSTSKGLQDVSNRIDSMITDITALGTSTAARDLFGTDGRLNTDNIADFMMSPTQLETQTLYPVKYYGSGMAPLMMNLSLWVGAFALVVIMKLEVDDDDLPETVTSTLTIGQRYWARWLLLAIPAVMQGLVTTLGELVIGVQTVNPFAFVATGMFTSLSYISIIYSLSTTFLHVGKGLCVALIMLQIPGSSGLYPVEMMPDFFRALYKAFPFTYSINAFRETIAGFYDGHWVRDIAVLALIAVIFFILGLGIRPYMTNVNKLFARELLDSDIVNAEPVTLATRPRIMQVLHALSDREEYRNEIRERAVRFARRYPQLKRAALIAGIVVPAVLAVAFSLASDAKVAALAAWIVWLVLIIGYLMALEITRDSIERQVALGTLSDEAILGLVKSRSHHHTSGGRSNMHATNNNTKSNED